MPLLRHSSFSLNGIPSKALPDLDYKRTKIDVFVPNDIFSRNANPLDYEDLKDDSSTNEEDRDARMLDQGRVMRPTKEVVYNEEDEEFMVLIPEPHEPKLFECSTKILRERQRRNHLLSSQTNFQKLAENDLLLNESYMKD